MSGSPVVLQALRRPRTVVTAVGLVVVVVVWLLVFFVPQGHKLTSLHAEEATLHQTVVADDAKLQRLRDEAHHAPQIQAMAAALAGYAPATEDLYTYIQVLSVAGKSAGITIDTITPSGLVAVQGTSYSAVPITTAVQGTYDQLLAFLHAVYTLPRLTDIDNISISGGGKGTSRSTVLSASLQLSIFTAAKPVTPGGS